MTRTLGGRKAGLVKAFLRGKPVWCSWQVTRRCASYCMFCEHRLEGGLQELDLAGCRRVVDQLSRLGSLLVSLTGGEPFLREDLAAIVAQLAERHFPLLTTHGWLVTEARAREVWSAGLEAATVRLSHADAARHDAKAGLAGAHERALTALGVLAQQRTRRTQRVNLHVPLHDGEAEHVEDVIAIARRFGATVTVEPAFPVATGRAGAMSAALLEMRRRHPELRSGSHHLGRMDEALRGGVPDCQAGRSFLNVDHRGRVSKCEEFQAPQDHAGDLLTGEVDDVLARLQSLCRENTCRSCWSASRGEVEGVYSVRGLARALPQLVRS